MSWGYEGEMLPDSTQRGKCVRPNDVAGNLGLLVGPTGGVVTLPRHLNWSGRAGYDLDSLAGSLNLYRTVLIGAASPTDLYACQNGSILLRLWPYLWPPALLPGGLGRIGSRV